MAAFRTFTIYTPLVTTLSFGVLIGCSARAANSGNAITIAAVGPMTGSTGNRGKDLKQAAQMAVDEVNAAGGVSGRRLQLALYDDGDQAAKARQLAHQIAETNAVAVLGQVASSAGVAAGEVYKERHIPAITGAASESQVTRNNDWFFRLFRSAEGQGAFLADYVRYRYDAHTIGVIRERGTAGEEFATALRDRATKLGIRIAVDQEFSPAEANDPGVLGSIAKVLSRLPKGSILVLGTQYAETPVVLRTLRDRLGPFTAIGYSSLATADLCRAFDGGETAGQGRILYGRFYGSGAPTGRYR